jgi:transcriptional regulator with GAF, ATPase, and Fis domain
MSVDLKAETFSQEFNEIFNNLDEMVASIVGQPYSGSITAEVIRTGAGQIVNSDDDRISSGELPLAQIVIDHGYSSILAVPLEFEGTINGTVVCSRLDGQYCEEDLITAGRISALLAGGLATFKIAAERDRAQLARSESEARGRIILEAEAAIGRILSVPLSRPGASEALISEIANVISLDHVVIVAVDLDTETFSPDFTEFLHDPRLMVVGNYGKLYAGSITAEVVKHGTGQIINSDDPRLVSGSLPIVQEMFGRGYRTMMAVPLVFEGNIIGTLILLSLRERIQQIRHGHSGPNRYHAGRRSRYFQIVH